MWQDVAVVAGWQVAGGLWWRVVCGCLGGPWGVVGRVGLRCCLLLLGVAQSATNSSKTQGSKYGTWGFYRLTWSAPRAPCSAQLHVYGAAMGRMAHGPRHAPSPLTLFRSAERPDRSLLLEEPIQPIKGTGD
jgi:hypothetical protein